MRIPESFVQEVVLRNPLEEIVSQYAVLKRAGSNQVCCCPFHHEKTPSFTVYTNTTPSHYHCYGCGVGGDVITFIRQMENLDYVSAIEFLANRAGLVMPVTGEIGPRVNRKRFFEMNAQAARFWHQTILSPQGKKGLDYLIGRGLTLPMIKHFGLGYAPESWDELCRLLQKNGYGEKEIQEAFLGRMGKNGRLYDLFRGRVMFPVIDAAGNVIAFSGRLVASQRENDPKYINTNDTPVFKKGRNVFALNFAKNSEKKELVLCEGNMDVVSLHAHGITHAVASLGTALTAEQCRLLSRYAKTVSICYDSDKAGRENTKKAIRLLQEAGLQVRVITLPETDREGKPIKDPDDFIRAFGRGGFEKYEREARGAMEYLFDVTLQGHEIVTMDGKNAFVEACTKLLSASQNPLEKALFIQRICEVTGLPLEIIRLQVQRTEKKEARREDRGRLEEEMKKASGLGNRVNPDKAKFLSQATKEENILGILLLRPEYLLDRAIRPRLHPEAFPCQFCRQALEKLLSLTESGEPFSFSALNEFFSPDQIGELEGMTEKRRALGNNSPAILLELIERLEEENKKKDIKSEPLSTAWLEKLKAEKAKKG